MTPLAIGVDFGGTNTKLVAIDREGHIHARTSFATPRGRSGQDVIRGLTEATSSFRGQCLQQGMDVAGVGFSVPHFIEGEDWVQRKANTIPELEGVPLGPPLRQKLGPSVAAIHDLDAGGIAEYRFGKGRGHDRMLFMAIGTGIAISVVTREFGLVRYSYDSTGDTGGIIVDPTGQAECTCGGRGCLEAYASGPAIARRASLSLEQGRESQLADVKARKGEIEARDVAEAAAAGDPLGRELFEEAGTYLGMALTSYLHVFGPDVIVLGGGVSLAGALLTDPVARTMRRLASPGYFDHLSGIELSSLGKDSAAVGCASLVLFPGEHLTGMRATQASA